MVKLNNSLYGLTQASRQWYALLKKCLLASGFEQCLADSCGFRLIRGGIVVLILVVHVDDIFVCLLYTSPSPRDGLLSRMPSSA